MSQISRKVLVVDDDPFLLEGLRRQLRRSFDVTIAVGPEAGLDVLESQGPFAVVVADYNMPVMNGDVFLHEVLLRSPHSVRVMLTGQTDLQVAIDALHEGGIFRFLCKPCGREELERALNDCLEQYRLIVSESCLMDDLNRANAELERFNQELEGRINERTATLRYLYGFVSALNGFDRMEDLCREVIGTTGRMLNSQWITVFLADPTTEAMHIAAATGSADEGGRRARPVVDSEMLREVFESRRSVVLDSWSELDRLVSATNVVIAEHPPVALAPLATPGRSVGVLAVAGPRTGERYGSDAVATLTTIASSAAIAMQNHIRLQQRNEARDSTIVALAKLAEHRDPETGAHLERVQEYCRLLAEYLATKPTYRHQIDRRFIDALVRSSPLHDIGKVGIPDRILLKPDRLTPDEYEIMKTHARIGGDILQSLIDQHQGQTFLEMGRDIAYYHHEKFDGSGYPFGMSGRDIPLPARILAVADVYDALTSKRVYKSAMDHNSAKTLVDEGIGRHFDPEIIEAFHAQESAFCETCVRLADDATEHDYPFVFDGEVADSIMS